MRISDWSSDVCSSDLENSPVAAGVPRVEQLDRIAIASEMGQRVQAADADAGNRGIVSVRPPTDHGTANRTLGKGPERGFGIAHVLRVQRGLSRERSGHAPLNVDALVRKRLYQ